MTESQTGASPDTTAAPEPTRPSHLRAPLVDDLARQPLLLEESLVNEQTIALWRLVFCLVVAVQVVLQLSFSQASEARHEWIALGAVSVAVWYSAALFVTVSRGTYRPWFSFISITLDISLITAGMLTLAVGGQPLFAVNNSVAVPLYLLAIALAGLRYNPRLTVYAALLAAGQHVLLVVYCVRIGDLYNIANPGLREQMLAYGTFDLVMQMTRVVLIGSGGVVATFGVRRARELRTASIIDALTQVYNRGFFDERYHEEFQRAQRYSRELSLAIVDVDNFKHYNDRNGHAAGDQVLREVADLLRFGLRQTDIIARYGGEEFVLLLPETGKERAVALVDRLRQSIASHNFLHGTHQPGGRLTISGGVASFPVDGQSPEEVFESSDSALYQAKAAGRNCVRG